MKTTRSFRTFAIVKREERNSTNRQMRSFRFECLLATIAYDIDGVLCVCVCSSNGPTKTHIRLLASRN